MPAAAEFVSIVTTALVAGVFWGPWLGLSRSMATFEPEVFLAIVHRMNRNLAGPMTVLMPLCLAWTVAVLLLSYGTGPRFLLALAALVAEVVAVIVTMAVEVPIVKTIATWTFPTLPTDWKNHRDRWLSFHLIRVAAGLTALVLLVAMVTFW